MQPGDEAWPLLLSPLRLGGLTLPNRVVMAPMSSSLADERGFVTPELLAFVRERAEGGTGLIVVEFSCVDAAFGRGERRQLRIDAGDYVAGHARLAQAITEAGARACLQLHLPGQYVVAGTCEGLPVAPSDEFARDGHQLARRLAAGEIELLVQRFGEAASRAVQAGYQAVEIHGAHGYLPMAFLSPRKNRRDDAWGGDAERRLAFPLAVVRAVRAALGPQRPLIYRLSAAEFVDPGLTLEDMERIVPRLARAGCDALHVSTGVIEGALDKIVDPMSCAEGWRFPLGRRLRAASGLPVIAVGPIRWPAAAERALAAGDADLIALGRPLLADPHWVRKVKAGALPDIVPCTNCNWCMQRVREHATIACAENPRTGRETEPPVPPAAPGAVAVVVGAGPGGLQAALEFDRIGYRTHLFEARAQVGGGLAVSAAPPFKEPLRWYQSHLLHRLQASGVTLHLGRSAVAADVLALRPDAVVLATGSRTRPFPLARTGAALPIRDATEILAGDRMPEADGPVVVYGGGETGCETAEYLAQRGLQVVLVTRSGAKDLARSAEPMYRRELRARLARNARIELVAHACIVRVDADAVQVAVSGGPSRRVEAKALVLAQGRAPMAELLPALRGAGLRCVVIGDAQTIGRIGDAVHAADRAVRLLAGAARFVLRREGGGLPPELP